jgi:hypothetical protein
MSDDDWDREDIEIPAAKTPTNWDEDEEEVKVVVSEKGFLGR